MPQQPGQPVTPKQEDPKKSGNFWTRHYLVICIFLAFIAVFGGGLYKISRPNLNGFIPDNVFRLTMIGNNQASATSYMYFGDKDTGYGAVGSTDEKKLEKSVAEPDFKEQLKKQVAGGKRNTFAIKNNQTITVYDHNDVAFKITGAKVDGNQLTGTLSTGNTSVRITMVRLVQ